MNKISQGTFLMKILLMLSITGLLTVSFTIKQSIFINTEINNFSILKFDAEMHSDPRLLKTRIKSLEGLMQVKSALYTENHKKTIIYLGISVVILSLIFLILICCIFLSKENNVSSQPLTEK